MKPKLKEEKARLELEHDSIIAPKGIIDDQFIEKELTRHTKNAPVCSFDLDLSLLRRHFRET